MLSKALPTMALPLMYAARINTLSLNECYRLQHKFNHQSYFLKILNPKRDVKDRLQELTIQKLVSAPKHSLSPPLLEHYHSDEMTWLLFPFYQETRLASQSEMMSCLNKLHQLQTHNINTATPLAWAKYYLDQSHGPVVEQLRAALQQLQLPPIQELKLCHFDVHPKNFLVTQDTTYLIDFENAGLFDPLYDLAVLMFYLGLEPLQCKNLLQLYKADATDEDLTRCLYYQKICLHLFLSYLVYQHNEIVQFTEMPIAQAQQNFNKLIKTYWLAKDKNLQKDLDKALLFWGLNLLESGLS